MRWPWQMGRRMSTLANPSQTDMDAFGVTGSFSGERVTTKKMLEEAGVYSAVRMISESIGSCSLKVYRVIPDSDERVEARTHRSWRMLHDAPNPLCTAHEFWAAVTVHLLVYENALILKERGPELEPGLAFVESLWLLDPQEWEMKVVNGRKVFIHAESQQQAGQDQILHIPGFSTGGYYGRSRADMCRQALGTAIARSKFEGVYWRQGGRIPGVIQHPGILGDEGVKRVADQMQAFHGGVDSMHKSPVFEEGMTMNWSPNSLEDMQFVELRQQTLTEIAVLFQLPPAYLGASTGDSLTYATTESNQIQYATMAVAPLANRIDKAVSNDPEILPWNVMYAQRQLDQLYRADMKTRAEYWSTMKTVLNLDPEYIASRENIPHSAIKPPQPVPAPLVANAAAVAEEQVGNGNGSQARVPVG